MRVLVTSTHFPGNWQPLVPFAEALQAAGHEVAFATTPATCAAIAALGFRCFPAGADETAAEAQLRRVQAAALPGTEFSAWAWATLFVGSWATRCLPDLLAICRDWAPAVLVREDMEFAGCIAAERCDLPHATVQVTAWRPWFRPGIAGRLNHLREGVGLPPDPDLAMLDRYLLISPVPPSYRDPAFPLPATARAVRPVPFDRSGDELLPAWVADLGDQPVVYATMGTAFNRVSGILATILEGLRDEPLALILTTGRDQDPAEFGPQPAHIRIARYVPQSLLFPHCDVAIFHGGSGTVMTAIEHGLPMVVIPVAADQPDNARRCQQLGIAQVILPEERTPEGIRAAARAVLRTPRYRQNAVRLRAELRSLPGPTQAVRWLERLATEKQPLIVAS